MTAPLRVGTRASVLARTQSGQVAEALTIHAALEEQYFYPFARQQGVGGLIDESFQDHAEVRQLLSEILQVKQTDPRLDELCLRLERMVTEHVGQEERALMPKVEAAADADQLVSMRDDMLQAIDNWRNKELLRLDCFELNPHYHYRNASLKRNIRLELDFTAEGAPIPWALDKIKRRLPIMLVRSGAGRTLGGCQWLLAQAALCRCDGRC